jgi:3-ketosteroid 9alpha-monooxygenase subunit A
LENKRKKITGRIPGGWFPVGLSAGLGANEIKSIYYFGMELILFRTLSGAVAVSTAFCPHLGAHLGQGTIEGENIRCPFHGWQFDTAGACTQILYAKKIPAKAKLPVFPSVEQDGMIFAYFDPEGMSPESLPPKLPPVDEEEWTPYEVLSWVIQAPLYEILEGGVDAAHLSHVHGAISHPECTVRISGTELQADTVAIYSDYKNPHNKKGVTVHTSMFSNSPGYINTKVVSAAVRSESVAFLSPIDAGKTGIYIFVTLKKNPNPTIHKYIFDFWLQSFKDDFERDKSIWETKRYLERPVICDGDGPIMKFRKWLYQFY